MNRILIIFVCLFLSPIGRGESQPSHIFGNNFISLRLARNFPMQRSQKYLSPGYYHPQVFYSHNVDQKFLMGLGLGFKSMRRNPIGISEIDGQEGEELAILSVSHNSQYILRLYHPHYLLIGAHLLYLFPSRKAYIPISRSLEFESEIGGGGSVGLMQRFSARWYGVLGLQWWRGTKTTRLQGIEGYGEMIYEIP